MEGVFMCWLCHKQCQTFEQFGLHLQSHQVYISTPIHETDDQKNNFSPIHTCFEEDSQKPRDVHIECKLCNKKFKTLCTFHNHITNCGNSGSFIIDYQNSQAYPLSEFCAYFEGRESICHDSSDDKSDTAVMNDNKVTHVLKDYLEALKSLFSKEKNKSVTFDPNIDMQTQTLSADNKHTAMTDDYEESLVLIRVKQKELNISTTSLKKRGSKTSRKSQIKDKVVSERKGKKQKTENQQKLISHEINTKRSATEALSDLNGSKSRSFSENDMDLDAFKSENTLNIEAQSEVKIECQTEEVMTVTDSDTKIKDVTLGDKRKNHNKKMIVKIPKKSQIKKPLSSNTQKRKRAKRQSSEACEICGKVVQHSKMKLHVISHRDLRPYACDLCPKTYKYPQHLSWHKRGHEEVLPFYCEICGLGCVSLGSLTRHGLHHKDVSERPFKCEVCGSAFLNSFKLKRHMAKHTGEKKSQCDLCGMRFKQKDNLNQHIANVHNKEKRFSCQECDRKFTTNYQLKCHTMKHAGVRPYKCTLCKADYIERKELRRHMKKTHNVDLDTQNVQNSKELENYSTNKSELCIPKEEVGSNHGDQDQVSQDQMTDSRLPSSEADCVDKSIGLSLPVFVTNAYQSELNISHDSGNRLVINQSEQNVESGTQFYSGRGGSEQFQDQASHMFMM